MNKKFDLPTKDEIKQVYDLPDEFEIEVRDATPPAKELKEKGLSLESVLGHFGVPTFLLRKGLLIIAVIFLPYWGPTAKQNFQDCIFTTTQYYAQVFEKFQQLPEPEMTDQFRYLVAFPTTGTQSLSAIDLGTGSFPQGTGIMPVSSSYIS